MYLEVTDAVAFAQSNLKNFQRTKEGSQPTQTLLPAAPNPHQQCITIGGLQDTANATPACKDANDGSKAAVYIQARLYKSSFVQVNRWQLLTILHMLNGFFKQHQVHDSVQLIIMLQSIS